MSTGKAIAVVGLAGLAIYCLVNHVGQDAAALLGLACLMVLIGIFD